MVEEIKLVGDAVYGHVATLNADGSGYGVLRPGPQMGRPRWSPDGKRLVASTGILGEIPSSIKVMNANGSQLRTVFGPFRTELTSLSVHGTGSQVGTESPFWATKACERWTALLEG